VTIGAGELCGFPIVLQAEQEWTTTTFFDEAGNRTRPITHGTEQDTFSANGKTLVGERYAFNFMAEFGNDVRVASYSWRRRTRAASGRRGFHHRRAGGGDCGARRSLCRLG
jgi:hypothetical protein